MAPKAPALEKPSTNGRKALAEAKLLQQAAEIKEDAAERLANAAATLEAAEGGEAIFEPEPTPAPEAPSSGKRKLDEILAELQGEGSFEVYHIQHGEDVKVGQYDIDQYPQQLEYIAKQKSGGQFKIRFRDSQGKHAGQLTRSFDSETYRTITAANPGGPVDMIRFMEMQAAERRESERQREAERREFQLQMERSRAENQAMMFKMIEALKPATTAPATSLTEIAGVMKTIQALTPQPQNPLHSVKELLEAVSLLREDTEIEVSPPWMKALDKAFAILTPIVKATAEKMAGAAQMPPAPGAGTPRVLPAPNPGPAVAVVEPLPQSPVVTLAKAYAPKLFEAAQAGVSPENLAPMIADAVNIPGSEADKEALLAFVEDETAVSEMLKAEPRLVPFKVWLESFAEELLEALDPQPEDTAESPEASEKGALEGEQTAS